MNNLSLEITLSATGKTKTFPLTHKACEYFQAGSWHEFLIPAIKGIDSIHLDHFTESKFSAWEIVIYHFLEGQMTSGDLDTDEDEAQTKYFWQILINGKPASYAEVDQSLNCDYWLHIESSRQPDSIPGSIPLDKGQWAVNAEGVYYLDETVPVLALADAIYEAAEVDAENGTEEDGTHYGKVLEAIEPILNRATECVKATIDGISYTFTLSRCQEA